MKKIFNYIKTYSFNTFEVDSLLVSAFIAVNKIPIANNILIKDYIIHNDLEKEKKLLQFIELLKNEIEDFTIEKLIEFFEFVISPSDRIINWAVYTPSKIRNYIILQALDNKNWLDNIKIADISCGCGWFLYTVAKELKKRTGNKYEYIFQNQIFWLDIQDFSVTRSILLLSLLALSEWEDIIKFNFNIYNWDALSFKWQDYYNDFWGFHIIVWNPPYVRVRNLDSSVRENLQNWSVSLSWNSDLYIPFFQIGYENLLKNGFLWFITMNSFFKSLNGRLLRKYFSDNQVSMRIIDFGSTQIFHSKSTYTCICFLEKTKKESIQYFKSDWKVFPENQNIYETIKYEQLNSKNWWNLRNNTIISQIESTGKPFGELFKTRHGIATLKNDIYIFKPVKEDEKYYYIKDISKMYPIEKWICKNIINTNKLSRKVSLEEIMEKIIFPYDNSKKAKLFNEDYIRLNFPKALKYLINKKDILAQRDKGKGIYENWYAFGRTQSLEKTTTKLFFPKISDKAPNCVINSDSNLLFYNWQAVIWHTEQEMQFIKKIMKSRLFWYYITNTSKPYSSNYYSLNWNYIRNFWICYLEKEEMEYVLNENDIDKLNTFLEAKYNISNL